MRCGETDVEKVRRIDDAMQGEECRVRNASGTYVSVDIGDMAFLVVLSSKREAAKLAAVLLLAGLIVLVAAAAARGLLAGVRGGLVRALRAAHDGGGGVGGGGGGVVVVCGVVAREGMRGGRARGERGVVAGGLRHVGVGREVMRRVGCVGVVA